MAKLITLKHLSFLSLSSLTSAALAFFTQVVIARSLGIAEFGHFSSALALVTLLAPLAGFGVSALWLKEFGNEGWNAMRWIQPSFQFVFGSTLAVFLSILLWVGFGVNDSSTRYLLLALSFGVFGQVSVELLSSKLQLEERYIALAAWQLLPHALRFVLLALTFFFSTRFTSTFMVGAIYAGVAIFCVLLSLNPLKKMRRGNFLLIGHMVPSTAIKDRLPNWSTVASAAWPFGVGAFAHLIYFQSDIILIKYIVGNESAGHYNVAFTILVAVYLLPSVLYQKFLLPKIHRWSAHNKTKFYTIYRKGNLAMLVFGLFSIAFVWLLGEHLIIIIFGESYKASTNLLKILVVSAPLVSVALSAGSTLVTNNHVLDKVKYMIMVAILNIIMNLFAIPIWGATGAAVTTVISNAVLLALYLNGAENKVFKNWVRV